MRLDRRQAILGAGALALIPRCAYAALPVPPGGRMAFDVLRKGSKLGTHTLGFAQSGGDLTITIAVDLIYKIGPITLYHYVHHNQEHWRGDRAVAFEADTNDNGNHSRVTGHRDESDNWAIEGGALAHLPAAALPATHWNIAEMRTPWINPQDGKLLHPRVAPMGVETVETGMGTMRAMHYALTGDAPLDIWYEPRLGWVAMAFTKGGAEFRYLRKV